MTLNEMVDAYLVYRCIKIEDFEDEDEFNDCRDSIHKVMFNLENWPVARVHRQAIADGWATKHFQRVVEFVISD